MARYFDHKLIFITGAASGIGRTTALKLAHEGADLALFDINENKLGEVGNQCKQLRQGRSPDKIVWATVDVANFEQCKAVFEKGVFASRPIDHVFNCAGINPTPQSLTDSKDDEFDRMFAVNVKGYYNVTKALTPRMKAGGSFINVGSICGLHPQKHMAIYCATKYAVTGFSKSMALELAPKGIRVNVVAPGFINTPTNSSVVAGPDAIKQTEAKISMERMGTPDEVADVVLFLMSDAARYMNGSVVEVNGGTG